MSDPRDAATGIVKRSVLVAGHATSVSIEEPFWAGLKDIALQRGVSLNGLIAAIDAERLSPNLSSAIRLAVLAHYRDRQDRDLTGDTDRT